MWIAAHSTAQKETVYKKHKLLNVHVTWPLLISEHLEDDQPP
jgi:hypothetical protein